MDEMERYSPKEPTGFKFKALHTKITMLSGLNKQVISLHIIVVINKTPRIFCIYHLMD